MKHIDILKTMPLYRGELAKDTACSDLNEQGVKCRSRIQVLFCFESESGRVGALCCQSCGQIKERFFPCELIALVSGLAGGHLPTEVSPHE